MKKLETRGPTHAKVRSVLEVCRAKMVESTIDTPTCFNNIYPPSCYGSESWLLRIKRDMTLIFPAHTFDLRAFIV